MYNLSFHCIDSGEYMVGSIHRTNIKKNQICHFRRYQINPLLQHTFTDTAYNWSSQSCGHVQSVVYIFLYPFSLPKLCI
ncbi:hypothetical protein EYC84_004832 [Monilinia fructicola]|uniref:Uncharacterized protein n=1 Tax=Monilinia fructicola TaxID=38448 RepID=A0A5M9K475_MONFR|nr:hypothetical protein EYC84_004832 [Monilinia fructicola]